MAYPSFFRDKQHILIRQMCGISSMFDRSRHGRAYTGSNRRKRTCMHSFTQPHTMQPIVTTAHAHTNSEAAQRLRRASEAHVGSEQKQT
jgi:hypothetical protein